jgi:cobalamin biosynthetic protein CobC
MQPTSDSQLPRHGGDLAFATARYGTPPAGWLDLSTGINPEPYPAPTVGAATLAALPQSSAHAALIEAARSAYRLPAATKLLAAPGSEIALRLLPLVVSAGPVAIVGPTYRSHSDAWSAAGRAAVEIASATDAATETAVLVLANPNNPDGRTIAGSDLAEIAERLAAKGGLLIVDEAFADLDPKISLAPLLDSVPAVVLRSFGKFYGLPGLRLGFVAGPASITDRLAQLLGDWPVSTAALAIGRAALTDCDWQNSTRRTLAERGKRLRSLLLRHGLRIAGGTDLFVLVEHSAADAIHAHFAASGIWTRTFSYRRDWLRIGLPANDAGFTRLETTIVSAMISLK